MVAAHVHLRRGADDLAPALAAKAVPTKLVAVSHLLVLQYQWPVVMAVSAATAVSSQSSTRKDDEDGESEKEEVVSCDKEDKPKLGLKWGGLAKQSIIAATHEIDEVRDALRGGGSGKVTEDAGGSGRATSRGGGASRSDNVVALVGQEADATNPSFSPFSITNGTHKQIED
jgi:hypothetical protein